MEWSKLVSMINSVTKSRAYFRHARWRGRRCCPWCKNRRIYRLSGGKFKCARCRRLFGEFSGTYLAGTKIPLNQVAYLLHMFVLGVPAVRVAKTCPLSMPTIERMFGLFRQAI